MNRLDHRVRTLVAAAFLVIAMLSATASAQSPAPLAAPHIDLVVNGRVLAMLRTPDGGVVLGGTFGSIDGVPRRNLAKLRADGSLDPAFDPSPDLTVNALAIDTNGRIYVGGEFYEIGGLGIERLARVSATGVVDPAWAPQPDSFVYALAVDSTSRVYVGGQFDVIGGVTRSSLARLSTASPAVVDTAWNPAPDNTVRVIAIASDDRVYVAGGFVNVSGAQRRRIARLLGSGSADPAWNPDPGGDVLAITFDASGRVYAGGSFTSIGGQTRNRIARLSAGDGLADAGWNPNADSIVHAITVANDGAVYVAGLFGQIGGITRRNLARLSATNGAPDAGWDPSPLGGAPYALLADTNQVRIGGAFHRVSSQYRLGFAVLSAQAGAAAQPARDVESLSPAITLMLKRPYGMLVGGTFYKADGVVRPYMLRLRHDGTIDATPNADDAIIARIVASFEEPGPLTINGLLRTIAALPDGSFVFGGSFTSVGGLSRNRLARLLADGSVDTAWAPSADNSVHALATDAAGNIYVGGDFTTINGTPRTRFARLRSDGTLDTTWNPSANQTVYALAVGTAGVYATGSFTTINDQPRRQMVRLGTTGSGVIDAAWNPGSDPFQQSVRAIAVGTDGSAWIGGRFDAIGTEPRARIARLGPDGALDPDWNPGADNDVQILALATDGKAYAGGRFLTIGGQPRVGLAAFAPVFGDRIFANGFDP